MSAREITRHRLANQHLTKPVLDDPVAVVAALGAVQAQDYAGARWGVALRARGLRDADVERAVDSGAIIRTHVLRPTWHLVAAPDIRWMLALTAPRVKAAMAHYDRALELDEAEYRRTNKTITKALEGGRHLTRRELAEVLRRARVEVPGTQRLAHIVMRAELDALLCNAPRRGKQATYALLDERVAPTKPLDRDEALLKLARRYFLTRGPATLQDFAWWSGLTVADGKRAVEMLGKVLEQRTIGERAYWLDAGAATPPARSPNGAHLLPNYDEYFIGFRDRSAIFEALRKAGRGPEAMPLVAHVVVVGGQVVGFWTRQATASGAPAKVATLLRLEPPARRAVDAAVARYRKFLG